MRMPPTTSYGGACHPSVSRPHRIRSFLLCAIPKPPPLLLVTPGQPETIRHNVQTADPTPPRLTITEDPKIPNAATVTLRNQDHTLGNMIRA